LKIPCLTAVLFGALICNPVCVQAEFIEQAVFVTGQGPTVEMAIQDGLAKAVASDRGIFIYDETRSVNHQITESRTKTITHGYVEKYEVLDQKEEGPDGRVSLTLKVFLQSTSPTGELIQKTHSDRKKVELGQSQKKLAEISSLLQSLVGTPEDVISHGYRFENLGFQVLEINPGEIHGHLLVKIGVNSLFWDEYLKLLEMAQIATQSAVQEGLYGSHLEEHTLQLKAADIGLRKFRGSKSPTLLAGQPSSADSALKIVKKIRLPTGMEPFLVPPIKIQFKAGHHTTEQSVVVHKNSVWVNIKEQPGRKIDIKQFHAVYPSETQGAQKASPIRPLAKKGLIYAASPRWSYLKESQIHETPMMTTSEVAVLALDMSIRSEKDIEAVVGGSPTPLITVLKDSL